MVLAEQQQYCPCLMGGELRCWKKRVGVWKYWQRGKARQILLCFKHQVVLPSGTALKLCPIPNMPYAEAILFELRGHELDLPVAS